MYPGRFDEQPIPLITIAWCGRTPNSESACFSAVRTPKSPHPGHQSGSALPLKSLIVSGRPLVPPSPTLAGFAVSSIAVSLIKFSLNHNLVHRHVLLGLAG